MPDIPIRLRCSGMCAVHCNHPQVPRRDDEVDKWLVAWQDMLSGDPWVSVQGMIDDYRLHADTMTPLDKDV